MEAVVQGGLCGVFAMWRQVRSSFLSDHVYNWSDCTREKYIFQPFCSGPASCSSRAANWKSKSASSRCGDPPIEMQRDGSAQSVHSRAMLMVPRSKARRIKVSMPDTRRFLRTSKRWPRSGWNGWRISAHPKCELRSSAVCADRPDGMPTMRSCIAGRKRRR